MSDKLRAGTVQELAELGYLTIETERGEICVLTDGDHYYALDDMCPHMGVEIHRGIISDGVVVCPMHRARFELSTGKSLDIYATDLLSYPVTVTDGIIFVDPTPRET